MGGFCNYRKLKLRIILKKIGQIVWKIGKLDVFDFYTVI